MRVEPSDETKEPEQIAAYNRALFVKSMVSQQRMTLGTGPSRKRPGGGVRGDTLKDESIVRLLVSSRRLLLRVEWIDSPEELIRPSDRQEEDRSVSG